MTTDLDRRLNEKYRAVVDEHTWMEPEILDRLATKTRLENASQKSRRQSLMHLADRFNAALAPQAACKAGCSACCSMTTMIYEHEAEALAAASGRPMKRLPFRLHNVALADGKKYFGIPCPFLVENRCSVYDVRPIICRLHHSLNDDASACDTRVPADQRKPVASYDVDIIEVPYHLLVREAVPQEPWATIHEFFPDAAPSGGTT